MAIGTTLKIGFDATSVKRGLDGLGSSVAGFTGNIAKMGIASLAAGLTAAGVGAIAFAKSASQSASETEALTSQFETLLGSVTAAKDRMQEITKFAAKTPFEIKELASTSKMLEVVAGKMLSTGDGLRLVGDAAALAGEPIQEVGLHIGRVFQAMTSGTSAGESVSRLQELGLISGQTKIRFQELAEQQKKGKADVLSQSAAFNMLSEAMSKTSGAMDKLSQTTQGKLSNLRDNIDQLKVSFGTGFNEGLKDALDATNNFLPKLNEKMKIAGSYVGTAISEAVEGDISKFELIGRIVSEGILSGIKSRFESGIIDMITSQVIETTGFLEKYTIPGAGKKKIASIRESIVGNLDTGKEIGTEANKRGLNVALQQLEFQKNKIQAGIESKERISQQSELVKQIKSQMFEEFAPGSGIKQQVTMTKALGILMSIDKKLTTPSPAKM